MQIRNLEVVLPQSPEDLAGGNDAAFKASLDKPEIWASIPLLNYTPLHLLKDCTLVRFRGMIQDMQDPEIYLERYEVKSESGVEARMQEGKYRDCLQLKSGEQVNYDADANVQSERRTLFVVSIPGINDWARNYEQSYNRHNLPEVTIEPSNNTGNGAKKRPTNEEDLGMESMDLNDTSAGTSLKDITDANKRLCVKPATQSVESNVSEASTVLSADYLLNSPIPERPSKACMVKIYEDFDTYTLNSLVDVVGFLSVDPALDATTMDLEMCRELDNVTEMQAENPPPSLIPRLHALFIHKMPHANPLLDIRLPPLSTASNSVAEDLNMHSVQKDLRMLLTLCLFNDDLAADYLLSHLISTVYSRSELQSIGKFTLNICHIPTGTLTDYTEKLYGILELLLPASHYLPMTLDVMNGTAFTPKKDYETNKLVSGLLQLAPHTHLVLDETRMQQGKLEANGVLGIQNLAYLINHQQMKCNFQYYEIDYNVDVPVLVLSEGRSMLPNDFTLPLKADEESIEHMFETLKAAHHFLQQNSRLDRFRRYLTHAKMCAFSLNPEDTEMIQNDFVEMRKTNKINTADDLHALLVLSRLLAIAQGKQVLDEESWELAKNLEAQRRQRVQERLKSKGRN